MSGTKYLEPGRRARIGVRSINNFAGTKTYKIFQGVELYQGRVGDKYLFEMTWTNEAEAQAFLDRLAKVRGWKKAEKK